MTPKIFSPWALLLFGIPIGLIVFFREKWFSGGKKVIYGFLRMTIQLTLLGYLLVFVFGIESPYPVLAAMIVMVSSSAWIALGPLKKRGLQLFWTALKSILLGAGSSLSLAVFGVLSLSPWWYPRYILPLAGMTFSAALNGVSLAAERFFAAQNLGANPQEARSQAYQAALIPYLNNLFSAGLVSIPGMMTGQILAGVSPLLAVKYQILIMALIFSSAGLSSLFFLFFVVKEHRNTGGRPV
ncbi:ABC transporter permease [Thermosulfurimonas dismutans]|uniref:YbbM seven transmembrane helix protein n=1 Tax=Thermosulfurimonas dismutans TaxID=999894 RepID=A0A179D550_9BACT|nr:ABC transporter permease [Thermosulfurimonas dismutans]OAQ21220.1 YbbM seven transmembrane helix protein [Thermosulfurimonas dismutans]